MCTLYTVPAIKNFSKFKQNGANVAQRPALCTLDFQSEWITLDTSNRVRIANAKDAGQPNKVKRLLRPVALGWRRKLLMRLIQKRQSGGLEFSSHEQILHSMAFLTGSQTHGLTVSQSDRWQKHLEMCLNQRSTLRPSAMTNLTDDMDENTKLEVSTLCPDLVHSEGFWAAATLKPCVAIRGRWQTGAILRAFPLIRKENESFERWKLQADYMVHLFLIYCLNQANGDRKMLVWYGWFKNLCSNHRLYLSDDRCKRPVFTTWSHVI